MLHEPSKSGDRLPPGWLGQTETKHLILAELSTRSALRHRRLQRFLAVGGTCAVLVLAGSGVSQLRQAPAQGSQTVVVTAPIRRTLPDGSVVEHKPDTAYTVHYSDTMRQVVLKRGIAHFDVVKNPARPFVVTAGGVSVRAVGTAFSVEFGPKAIEVLVTEGRVTVASAGTDKGKRSTSTTVDAGSGVKLDVVSVAVGDPPHMAAVSAEEFVEKLAWRVRLVEFSGTPLEDAVRILNQHNRVQFSIADAALAKLKLSGVIRPDRIAGVVRLLEEEGVQVEQRGETEIVLRLALKN